jgi:hypothetical protein
MGENLPKEVKFASSVYYPQKDSVFLFRGDCREDIIRFNVLAGESVVLNEALPSHL